jgi:hypothetical protein
MNVGELLRERDRLLGVIEEAKSARSKLKQINVLVALYGTVQDGPKSENGDGPRTPGGKPLVGEPVYCEQCQAGPYSGERGLGTHMRRMHGSETPEQRAATAGKAGKAAAKKAARK